jgi:hypothetical protein
MTTADTATWPPSTARAFVIGAMGALLSLLILWSTPPDRAVKRIGLRIAVLAIALATMITLFVTVDHDHSRDTAQLARWYAASAGYDAYLLVYHGVFPLAGIHRAAYIEAACLHAALAAKASNRLGNGSPTDHRYAGTSLDDEVHWLAHLSRAFADHRSAPGGHP